jgi:hypothetical protein
MVHAVLHSKAVRSKNFLRLSFSALALYAAGSCYSADELTDGVLTREELVVAAPQFAIRGESIDAAIAELVAGGQLSEIEPGKYRYTDFLELNASRADIERKRQADNDRYAARQSGRKRKRQAESRSHSSIERDAARITDPTQTQQGVDSHRSYSSATMDSPPQSEADLSAQRPTEISHADRTRNAAAPPVPPRFCSLTGLSKTESVDLSETTGGAKVEEVLTPSDLNPEEKKGEPDPNVSAYGKQWIARADYEPSDALWGQWAGRVTVKQWQETLRRYQVKGRAGTRPLREHEFNFRKFLKQTLYFAGLRQAEKRKRAERQRSEAATVSTPRTHTAEPLTPSIAEPIAQPPAPSGIKAPPPPTLSYEDGILAGLGRDREPSDYQKQFTAETHARFLKENNLTDEALMARVMAELADRPRRRAEAIERARACRV